MEKGEKSKIDDSKPDISERIEPTFPESKLREINNQKIEVLKEELDLLIYEHSCKVAKIGSKMRQLEFEVKYPNYQAGNSNE